MGTSYSKTLAASGGTSPYTWSVTGGSLPSGLSLSTAGVLSGTPTAGNTYSFTITATDSTSQTGSQAFSLTIYNLGYTPFVTSKTLGTVRNDYSGWVGMAIQIGSSDITANSLGRIVVAGNSGTHTVKIADSTGTDVAGGSVSVSMSGGTPGSFVYGNLASPVTLSAGATYYILSQEASGGDQWYDYNTTVQTTSVASVTSAAFGSGSPYSAAGSAGQTYAPVDFLYGLGSVPTITTGSPLPVGTVGTSYSKTLAASGGTSPYTWSVTGGSLPSGLSLSTAGVLSGTPTAGNTYSFTITATDSTSQTGSQAFSLTIYNLGYTPFVTSKTLGTVRNDYSGWVGMAIQIGSSDITANSLGRIVVAGNSGTHTVKIADSTGTDVAGGSVSVSMSGGTPGSFVYGNLASPVTLSAGATYYILSQEASGGDQWYDYNTTVQTTSVASVTSAAFGSGSPYSAAGSAGQTYAPVDFLYGLGGGGSQVSSPTFSPGAGTYTTTQVVTISTPTASASIRYTTDGSTPTSSVGTVYSAAINVSATTTVKAIAYLSGMTDSTVASATYTIGTQQVATPTFTPPAGTYSSEQFVRISTATPGATIRYTIDGSTPSDTAGIVYGGGLIAINATTTINAIAYASGYTISTVGTAVYTIQAVQPSITGVSPTSGTPGTQVTISGSGFGSVRGTGAVWLGSTVAAVVSWSDTQVVATVLPIPRRELPSCNTATCGPIRSPST